MTSVIALLTLAAAVYAVSYSKWLAKNGNKLGGISVNIITLITLAVSVYRFIKNP